MAEPQRSNAIESLYPLRVAEEPVELYSGPFELDLGRGFESREGVVQLEWNPKPMVVVRYSGKVAFDDFRAGLVAVKIPGFDEVLHTAVLDYSSTAVYYQPVTPAEMTPDGFGYAALFAVSTLSKGQTSGFASVIVHVVNFRDFAGTPVRIQTSTGGSYGCNRMSLRGGEWQISIDTVPNATQVVRTLGLTAGHAITCTGKIERSNREQFGVKELGEAVDFLNQFMSFCNADRCSIVMPVAYDRDGNEVWRGWNACLEARWQGKTNWTYHMPATFMSEAFPGFYSRWSNPMWREPIEMAIGWYLQAKRGTIESVLILTQSALELLSWVMFVEDEKVIVGTDNFEKMWASDRIRLFLNRLSINLEIPIGLPELKAAKVNNKLFADGPHAITEIRNAIVHPKKSKREALAGPRIIKDQAARLGLWYLELALLKLFGFTHQVNGYTLMSPTQDGL